MHFSIEDWMIKGLGIKGSELLLYAIIYGYSVKGQGCYYGSIAHLMDTLEMSKPTIISSLRSLKEKGLLERIPSLLGNGGYVYEARGWSNFLTSGKEILQGGKEILPQGKKTLPAGGKKTLPNTIYNDTIVNTIKDTNNPLTPLPYDSTEFVDTWNLLLQQPKWRKKSRAALEMSAKMLSKYPEATALAMMQNTIANDWQGLFPPKAGEQGAVKTSTAASRAREATQRYIAEIEEANRREIEQQMIEGTYGQEDEL